MQVKLIALKITPVFQALDDDGRVKSEGVADVLTIFEADFESQSLAAIVSEIDGRLAKANV